MASSRWKRFAFFDRRTLNLPPEVLEDVLPTTSRQHPTKQLPSHQRQPPQSQLSSPPPLLEFEEEVDDERSQSTAITSLDSKLVGGGVRGISNAGSKQPDESDGSHVKGNRNHDHLHEQEQQQQQRDSVSLVVTTAALPLLSKPVTSNRNVVTNASTNAGITNSFTPSASLEAMWSSLTACAPQSLPDFTANGDANQATSTISSTTATIDLPSQGKQSLAVMSTLAPVSNLSSPLHQSSTSLCVEGLVLCFLTSRNTQLVHCVDLTVRCNPPPASSMSSVSSASALTVASDDDDDNNNSKNNTSSNNNNNSTTSDTMNNKEATTTLPPTTNSAAPTSASSTLKNERRKTNNNSSSVLEDMDGWRGYFAPFPPPPPTISNPSLPTTTSSTTASTVQAIAACRCPNRHRPIHLACISSIPLPSDGSGGNQSNSNNRNNPNNSHATYWNQIVVWEDPHLHLIYRKPISTNPSTIAPPSDAIIYTTSNYISSASNPSASNSNSATTSGVGAATSIGSGASSANTIHSYSAQSASSSSWTSPSNTDGAYQVVAIVPGLVAVGTNRGVVHVYAYTPAKDDSNHASTTSTARPTVTASSYSSTRKASASTNSNVLRPLLRIPSPPVSGSATYNNINNGINGNNANSNNNNTKAVLEVVSVRLAVGPRKAYAFVSYGRGAHYNSNCTFDSLHSNNNDMSFLRQNGPASNRKTFNNTASPGIANGGSANSGASSMVGICCYEIPLSTVIQGLNNILSAPSARHDLDGRYVTSSTLVDLYDANNSLLFASATGVGTSAMGSTGMSYFNQTQLRQPQQQQQQQHSEDGLRLTVARPDGLYSYSKSERIGVAPIDGTKLAMCIIPPPISADKRRHVIPLEHRNQHDNESNNSNAINGINNINNSSGAIIGTGYVLVASNDSKSGRDAVDIFDVSNNLVAFHLLLSPGHRAIRAAGVTTSAAQSQHSFGTNHFSTSTNSATDRRAGQSSAVVFTSGGSLITLTEKRTDDKIALLVQKNLYSAAIVVAYSDPMYEAADITALYQIYAEYLYRKGDFSGAMDQYIQTIGSLETSHVIFRYLDAPKIPLLVKYLEKVRALALASTIHNELLRTCYLKLNDTDAAEAIVTHSASSFTKNSATNRNAASNSTMKTATSTTASLTTSSILSNLTTNPKEALIALCSLEAPQAAEILMVHGAALGRALPRETAGIVISLCLGTYSPTALADISTSFINNPAALYRMLQYNNGTSTDNDPNQSKVTANSGGCQPYPPSMFLPRTFVEHPKMLRLVLAHCNRNKGCCVLTPSLRRTLLELTLAEWNQAKRSGDTEMEKLRYKEAMTALTDANARDIGDYNALVLVQLAGFDDGELLLYERLQMTPMLLEQYAADGSEKSRRRMLALCHTDPELLADVLRHFVTIASSNNINSNKILRSTKSYNNNSNRNNEVLSSGSIGPMSHYDDDVETDDIIDDIQECLALAKQQGVLSPVRITRILAGEDSGQFSSGVSNNTDHVLRVPSHSTTSTNSAAIGSIKNITATTTMIKKGTVPLSVALDYVGTILEESRTEIARLKSEVEEYNQLCNSMENETISLLRISQVLPPASSLASGTSNATVGDGSVGGDQSSTSASILTVEDLYAIVRMHDDPAHSSICNFADRIIASEAREAFWREMDQSEDTFETISRFFAKGVIH